MHAGHQDGGDARIERSAPFAPQFEGDEEGISRDHDGAERDALVAAFRERRQLAQHDPDKGAEKAAVGNSGRPWNSRTPFQIMPQARNVSACANSLGKSIIGAGAPQSAIDDAPIK